MLQKSIKARGGRLVLRNMQPQVREVFDITGFSSIIEII
jgi:anti-anti-sigma factor